MRVARLVIFGVMLFLFLAMAVIGTAAIDVQISPIPSDAYVFLGNYFFRQGDMEKAVMLFNKAVEKDDNSVAHHNLGFIHYENGDFEKAEFEFRKAVEADEDYEQGQNSLAILLFEKGDLAGAAEHFTKVVEINPENAQAHFDLGVSIANNVRYNNANAGGLAVALEHFREAERIQPGYPYAAQNIEVMESIVQSYYELKDLPD
ncbi:tetratricopeptide repeat protein [Candidatus Woesearchaeota archaeon]|nr:tetratricopeptide repeat protein [Candidatus Woesearchaeota archaeon]